MNRDAYIADLERENARLISHHSECKAELGRLVETAQKWRIRSFVTEKLLSALNKISKWWYPEDLKKEIQLHEVRLLNAWKRRESWGEL